MDADEKRFWVGITVFATLFGVGGYVVFEHAIWGWIFMVAGVGGLVLGIIERVRNVRMSSGLWLIAILVSWAMLCYDYYDRHNPEIPEFDDPLQGWDLSYAGNNGTCMGSVDGSKPQISRFSGDYRVALACYYADPTKDRKDNQIYVSAEYDITKTPINMTLTYTPLAPGLYGSREFEALFIPRNVSITQFRTLREARALGVKIKHLGGQQGAAG